MFRRLLKPVRSAHNIVIVERRWCQDQPSRSWYRDQPSRSWYQYQPSSPWGQYQPSSPWGQYQPSRSWGQYQPSRSWCQYQPSRSWCQYQPSISWYPVAPHRNHSSARRPPDPFSWREWTRPGVLPYSDPQNSFHLFSGLMDRSEKEALRKRKSTEDNGSAEDRQRSSKRSSRAESQKQSAVWLRSVTGTPLPPGKFPPKPETPGSKTELKREWEEVCGFTPQGSGSIHGQPFDFSVMSYNILSQELLLSNPHLYQHCNPVVLDWSHRSANIIAELKRHSADIMCLQEVQEDHYLKQIKPSLESLGYHCEYKRRTGRKPDGCAVVFKRERFSLLSRHPVEYFQRGIPLLDRDNVGLILLLQPVEPSASTRSVCVANTHLLYNPRRGDIKLAQLAMLLAEISRVAGQAGDACPVVLCGDFNSVPWSPLCRFIKTGCLEYADMPIGKVSGQEESPRGQRHLTAPIWPGCLGISQQCQYEPQTEATDQEKSAQSASSALNSDGTDPPGSVNPCIQHGLSLTSAYSHYLRESRRPEITTCHARTAITVDYIFYSAQTECSAPDDRGLQLLARLALVDEGEVREVNLLPNQHHSSDHLPLIARFRLVS
ncbi:protein angel homolog 2 [Brachyhypopomus gauderio]|uniref:protein angel homolog 2 n=1 Tax=Brachyhypopomus gauderio TaxID=698409 RepID=UPI0040432D3A